MFKYVTLHYHSDYRTHFQVDTLKLANAVIYFQRAAHLPTESAVLLDLWS